MNILCPKCGFAREVAENKLPAKAVMATCPKCKHRFKFREVPEAYIEEPAAPAVEEPQSAPRQPVEEERIAPVQPSVPDMPSTPNLQQDDDDALWKELEALHNDDDCDDSDPEQECVHPTLPVWEQAEAGYPRAYIRTFLDVITNPRHFFRAMPVGIGYIKPLLFFLIIIEIVAVTQSVWQLLGILPPSMLVENLGHSFQAALELILYPLEVSLLLFMETAINHGFLKLFKADSKGFEGTFRVATYSSAPMLLLVVPYIGLPLAMVGVTICKFLGLKHVHRASNKQIVGVMVLPILLMVALLALTVVLSGGNA